MLTRKQYMNKECTHQEYNQQFITPAVKRWVKNNYSREFLIDCYSKDENLNNLGRTLVKMDRVWGFMDNTKTVKVASNCGLTRADNICIIKAYMILWIESEGA